MKVGLSYSRCIRDIVEGKVNIDDVLVIISRTDFDPHDDKQWRGIWIGYGGGTDDVDPLRMALSGANPEWAGFGAEYEDQFRSVSIELWEQGKFHQPRKFGAHPARRREFWLETFLPDDELMRNPSAKAAWEKFQTVANLVSSKPMDTEYQ